MEHDVMLRISLEYDQIAGILREEEQYFRECHHRDPVGREREDVVDNAWSRIQTRHGGNLLYTDVAGVYSEMRCDHAGC